MKEHKIKINGMRLMVIPGQAALIVVDNDGSLRVVVESIADIDDAIETAQDHYHTPGAPGQMRTTADIVNAYAAPNPILDESKWTPSRFSVEGLRVVDNIEPPAPPVDPIKQVIDAVAARLRADLTFDDVSSIHDNLRRGGFTTIGAILQPGDLEVK